MSGRSDENSARSRIISAADRVFASAVPAAACASTTSRFDIVGRVLPGGGWVQARLLQWHRVGNSGLRCFIALDGPARPTYKDAVAALDEQMEHLSHASTPLASAATLRSSSRRPLTTTTTTTTTTPPPLTYTASLETSLQTPTGTHPSLTPTSLTPRATITPNLFRTRSSFSTSSTSTIRPSTAPPGALPATYSSVPPLPGPVPAEHLTPNRSLTSRLTPFHARWGRRLRDTHSPQTPTRQRRTASLQRWSSKMKSSRGEHKQQLQRLKTSTPMYTLDPDQGPSPDSPTGGLGRTMPPMPPAALVPTARPRGPRQQPDRGDQQRGRREQFERPTRWAGRDAGVRMQAAATTEPFGEQETQRMMVGSASRTPRASGQQPLATQPSSAWHDRFENGSSTPATRAIASVPPRPESPVSETVWDDIDELTRELRERNRLDQQRSLLQERARLCEEAELRQRRENRAILVRGGHEATTADEADESSAREDGVWHPRSARRFPWPLRSSRSKSRSRE